jgi:hypothetical protein
MRLNKSFAFAAMLACIPASVSLGQVIYTENFDVDPTANWTVNTSAASGSAADFFFDYSTVGIPAAPGAVGTRGLKLEANIPGTGTFSGISVSPTGFSASGEYQLRFNMWQNFNGPFPVGGSGSTQATFGNVGTTGTTAQFPGGTVNGALFATTTDGNSASDYRAYVSGGAPLGDTTGVYAAGNVAGVQNSSNAYYNNFGSQTAPAAQVALFPQQTGTTAVGSQGMSWHEWLITVSGGNVTWAIDGKLIATVPAASVNFAGGNISLGHFDTNTTSSTDVNARSLLFGLIDNVTVTVIPEPASIAMAVAAIPLLARRRR